MRSNFTKKFPIQIVHGILDAFLFVLLQVPYANEISALFCCVWVEKVYTLLCQIRIRGRAPHDVRGTLPDALTLRSSMVLASTHVSYKDEQLCGSLTVRLSAL